MTQTLKPALRAALLDAARDALAADGWSNASIADVARRAGVSAGNVYRYFPDRDALFRAAVPPELAEALLVLVERRVLSLARGDLAAPDADARADAEAFLSWLVAHRREAAVLLDGAAGGPYATFAERFTEVLSAPARTRFGARAEDPAVALLVPILFRNTVRALAGILRGTRDEAEIRRAFEGFWAYQLAGLAGFDQWVSR